MPPEPAVDVFVDEISSDFNKALSFAADRERFVTDQDWATLLNFLLERLHSLEAFSLETEARGTAGTRIIEPSTREDGAVSRAE